MSGRKMSIIQFFANLLLLIGALHTGEAKISSIFTHHGEHLCFGKFEKKGA